MVKILYIYTSINKYGEDAVTLIKLAIDSWYNEILLYDFTPFRIEDAQSASLSPLITARKAGVLYQ